MARMNVTVPDEQKEWLNQQPQLNASGLLQKAIRGERERGSPADAPAEAIGHNCPVCGRQYEFAMTKDPGHSVMRVGPMRAEDICYFNGIFIGHTDEIGLRDDVVEEAVVEGNYVWTATGEPLPIIKPARR